MRSPQPIRLGLLQTGENLPDLVPEHGTMAQWFISFLNRIGRAVDYRSYQVYKGEMPARASECDAWLVTGSAAGVNDNLSWIEGLRCFSLEAAECRPLVGVCFGHQLLHQIYGGRVEPSEKGWGIGVHRYQVRERRNWMNPATDVLRLLASHRDQVVEPAPNSCTLAGSAFCPVALSEFGENVISIQPHPELAPSTAVEFYKWHKEAQGHEVTESALRSMESPIDDLLTAQWILNFLEERLPVG